MQCEQCELIHSNPQKRRNVKIVNAIARDTKNLNRTEKDQIVRSFHNCFGHLGTNKTFNLIRENYDWQGLADDVKKIISEYQVCAERKVIATKKTENIQVSASQPFEKIMIDIFGPVVRSRYGHRFALGIVDVYSRFPMIIPLRSTESKTIVNAILSRWVSLFGCPDIILSDGGPNINSCLVKKFCDSFGICKVKSSPYHPQTIGKIEHLFRTVKDMIYTFCQQEGSDWVDAIPHIEMGLRAADHQTNKFSPYYVLFGKKMNTPLCNPPSPTSRSKEEYVAQTNRIRDEIQKVLQSNVPDFNGGPILKIGDLVMIREPPSTGKGILKKRFFGPGRIENVVGAKTYDIVFNRKIFRRNISNLKLFKRQEYRSKSNIPPTIFPSSFKNLTY